MVKILSVSKITRRRKRDILTGSSTAGGTLFTAVTACSATDSGRTSVIALVAAAAFSSYASRAVTASLKDNALSSANIAANRRVP
ncbi:hypothetical protein V6N13_053425 [Hibiscus sabdariffa]|uniref:Uncharacterized protein n=1 Tax=Hibiscus sabdariffa TaxID=183260 RepID=A0ABR2T868_9ROSI